jgi:hypothetical protein
VSHLVRCGCSADTLRALAPDDVWHFGWREWNTPLPPEDEALIKATTAAVLQEARQRAFYAPQGVFKLQLPEVLRTLHRHGIHAMTLSVDQAGIWARIFYDDPLDGPEPCSVITSWRPERPESLTFAPTTRMGDGCSEWLDAVFASLWRDLRVAGERSIQDARSPKPDVHEPGGAEDVAGGSGRQEHNGHSGRRLALPRSPAAGQEGVKEPLRLSGRRRWGSTAEHRRITRWRRSATTALARWPRPARKAQPRRRAAHHGAPGLHMRSAVSLKGHRPRKSPGSSVTNTPHTCPPNMATVSAASSELMCITTPLARPERKWLSRFASGCMDIRVVHG